MKPLICIDKIDNHLLVWHDVPFPNGVESVFKESVRESIYDLQVSHTNVLCISH